MTKFFVSYSRSVKDEVCKVVDLLKASRHEVWWDADIPAIVDWWATILSRIEWCEVFIFVASEKSVQSAYCLAELNYAVKRNRPVLPFILEDVTTTLPDDLPPRGQWLVYDGEPVHMLEAINKAVDALRWDEYPDISAQRPPEPLKDGVSNPQQFQEARRLADVLDFDVAERLLRNIKGVDFDEWGKECNKWLACLSSYKAIMPLVDDSYTHQKAREKWSQHVKLFGKDFDPYDIDKKLRPESTPLGLVVGGVATLLLVALIVGLTLFNGGGDDGKTSAINKPTTEASRQVVADDPSPSDTPSLTPSSSPTATDTAMPTLSDAEVQATINAEVDNLYATATQSAADMQTATAVIGFTVEAGTAQDLTLTATNASPTPSADYPKTAQALVIQTGIARGTQAELDKILTVTHTTHTPTPTDTLRPSATAMIDPVLAALQKAEQGVSSNAEWVPIIQDFGGVEMVLVPAGCFMMGSSVEQIDYAVSLGGQRDWFTDEQPVHEICFEEPFWIDRYEVSNAQFTSFGGRAGRRSGWTDDNLPRESITWFEARDFCELREARLPTEAEWEYAARGPDGLEYPWGDEFEADNVVYSGNSGGHIWAVGSKPDGVSWVGALDMSGNVWEWVSTIYNQAQFAYPYNSEDGREDRNNTNKIRVLRGGSWLNLGSVVRSAFRYRFVPSDVLNFAGFRCARSY